MRSFSKSKLLAFRQCPKRLWLEVNHPELRENSAATEAGFSVGNQVGDKAHGIYDPESTGAYINVAEEGFSTAFARTQMLLQGGTPIFEAGFCAAGGMAFADVMLPVTNTTGKKMWRMVEVKSSTALKDYHRDDAAIQATIARSAGVELAAIVVAHIDNTWVYQGDGNYVGLLKEVDVTAEAFARADEVKGWITESQAISSRHQAPDIAVGKQCTNPYACGFITHCHNASTVSDAEQEPYFNAEGAAADLAAYPLPALFLDFETVQFAIPQWKGWRAYQQIPFQFSVHYLDSTHQVRHAEFLDLSGNDPAENFAKALITACGESGAIFVYSHFEKTRIRELAERFPSLSVQLLALNERLVDLLPIARQHFNHPSQNGSWSLKVVLPAACSDLRYDQLEGVQNGGMAMEAYQEAIHPQTTPERKAEINRQLLAYCKLDTWALVRLWGVFRGIVID